MRSRHRHKYTKYFKISQYEDVYMYKATPKQHLKLSSWKS